jgi:hypothetical protein
MGMDRKAFFMGSLLETPESNMEETNTYFDQVDAD